MKRLKIHTAGFWIVLFFFCACSDEAALQLSEGEAVHLGGITTRAGSTWIWETNDEIKATALGQSATFKHDGTGWGASDNVDFTKEFIGVNEITLEFGNSTLIADQSDPAKYRSADYLKGIGQINYLSIDGSLDHQQCDLELTIVQGTGWDNETEFKSTLSEASCLFASVSASDVTPYHAENVFRAIFPPANVLKGTNVKIATLTFGSTDKTPVLLRGETATITYTNNSTDLKNKRLKITTTLNTDCSVSITVGINNWDKQDIASIFPGELVKSGS